LIEHETTEEVVVRTPRERPVAGRLSLAIVAVAAIGALAIAGCGGDDEGTTTSGEGVAASGDGAQAVAISETDFTLDPSDPEVKPGTVTFNVTNDGSADHNLEVEGPEGEQELEQDLAPGQNGTLTVDLSKPGRYEFYCPVDSHRERGMEGEITVTSGGAGSADSGSADSGSAAGGGGSAGGSTGGGYGY
jgi:uncharacterized cupredoxin-like copper-binding protein